MVLKGGANACGARGRAPVCLTMITPRPGWAAAAGVRSVKREKKKAETSNTRRPPKRIASSELETG